MYKYIYTSLIILSVFACNPDRDDVIQLPDGPGAPTFSVEALEGDANRFVIKDLSEGNFQRLWSMPEGAPNNSNNVIDTVFYQEAGEYDITLHVSKADGSGTSSSTQKVTVTTDAPLVCSPKLAILTGDCGPGGRCWTLSKEQGAVRVGPTYDDFSWFTSAVDGLQDAQYDDGFCFTFDGLVFKNSNSGASVNPWNGYSAESIDHGMSSFIFQEGTGINNKDQIIIPDEQFMGVWDFDNVMDVMQLSNTKLVLRAKVRAANGTPNAEGWFELTFVPQ